ncbi:MAG: hypothetical protein V7K92_20610 [Nostoc sp.]|uniref:hypothetical protein n=1 Tax=Nostoc sp. TaxID=1180 RepID=UPI002FF22DF8
MSTKGYAYAAHTTSTVGTILLCDRSFESKPQIITQIQFCRKLLTNQYSWRSPSSVETTKNYN